MEEGVRDEDSKKGFHVDYNRKFSIMRGQG
jgi:hypothetical protein